MNEEHIVNIRKIEQVTHDVKRFQIDKPKGYTFHPGQATEVAINNPQWKEERRPFTFTCLNDDPYLEFTIKIYQDHPGVTNELGKLKAGDQLIIHDVWGAIEYKGPGYFIAGGAGITPFIAILRQLNKDGKLQGNTLFFSNKTSNDIILESELSAILGKNAFYIVTQEKNPRYHNDFLNEAFFNKQNLDINKQFYVCGPPKMIESVNEILQKRGAKADNVVFEK
jgi:ferredoxin-NADP reductase